MVACAHDARMKMRDPFCSGRCPTVPVFVLSVQQWGSGLTRLRLTPAPADSELFPR